MGEKCEALRDPVTIHDWFSIIFCMFKKSQNPNSETIIRNASLLPMVTIEMNVAEIITGMHEIAFKMETKEDIDKILKITSFIEEMSINNEIMEKKLVRLEYFHYLSDNDLAALENFHEGKRKARPGRKSTVKDCIHELEWTWEYFLKIPALFKERCIEIESEYPRSIVYKALKKLC